jgi:hypothetical protein
MYYTIRKIKKASSQQETKPIVRGTTLIHYVSNALYGIHSIPLPLYRSASVLAYFVIFSRPLKGEFGICSLLPRTKRQLSEKPVKNLLFLITVLPNISDIIKMITYNQSLVKCIIKFFIRFLLLKQQKCGILNVN